MITSTNISTRGWFWIVSYKHGSETEFGGSLVPPTGDVMTVAKFNYQVGGAWTALILDREYASTGGSLQVPKSYLDPQTPDLKQVASDGTLSDSQRAPNDRTDTNAKQTADVSKQGKPQQASTDSTVINPVPTLADNEAGKSQQAAANSTTSDSQPQLADGSPDKSASTSSNGVAATHQQDIAADASGASSKVAASGTDGRNPSATPPTTDIASTNEVALPDAAPWNDTKFHSAVRATTTSTVKRSVFWIVRYRKDNDRVVVATYVPPTDDQTAVAKFYYQAGAWWATILDQQLATAGELLRVPESYFESAKDKVQQPANDNAPAAQPPADAPSTPLADSQNTSAASTQ